MTAYEYSKIQMKNMDVGEVWEHTNYTGLNTMEVVMWCNKTFGKENFVYFGARSFYFKNKEDLGLFLTVWA